MSLVYVSCDSAAGGDKKKVAVAGYTSPEQVTAGRESRAPQNTISIVPAASCPRLSAYLRLSPHGCHDILRWATPSEVIESIGSSAEIPWNDIYQTYVDIEPSSMDQHLDRADLLEEFLDLFAAKATACVQRLVHYMTSPRHALDGDDEPSPYWPPRPLPPTAAGVPNGGAVYFMDNLFFMFAFADKCDEEAGVSAAGRLAAKVARREVEAASAMLQEPASGGVQRLRTPLMCVVNYAGHTVYVQAPVPVDGERTMALGVFPPPGKASSGGDLGYPSSLDDSDESGGGGGMPALPKVNGGSDDDDDESVDGDDESKLRIKRGCLATELQRALVASSYALNMSVRTLRDTFTGATATLAGSVDSEYHTSVIDGRIYVLGARALLPPAPGSASDGTERAVERLRIEAALLAPAPVNPDDGRAAVEGAAEVATDGDGSARALRDLHKKLATRSIARFVAQFAADDVPSVQKKLREWLRRRRLRVRTDGESASTHAEANDAQLLSLALHAHGLRCQDLRAVYARAAGGGGGKDAVPALARLCALEITARALKALWRRTLRPGASTEELTDAINSLGASAGGRAAAGGAAGQSGDGKVPAAAAAQLRGKPYYRPHMDRAAAEAYLLGQPHVGVFVIRASSQPNSVALSHRDEDGAGGVGRVGHAIIHVRQSPKTGAALFSIEKQTQTYTSLQRLIETLPLRRGAATAAFDHRDKASDVCSFVYRQRTAKFLATCMPWHSKTADADELRRTIGESFPLRGLSALAAASDGDGDGADGDAWAGAVLDAVRSADGGPAATLAWRRQAVSHWAAACGIKLGATAVNRAVASEASGPTVAAGDVAGIGARVHRLRVREPPTIAALRDSISELELASAPNRARLVALYTAEAHASLVDGETVRALEAATKAVELLRHMPDDGGDALLDALRWQGAAAARSGDAVAGLRALNERVTRLEERLLAFGAAGVVTDHLVPLQLTAALAHVATEHHTMQQYTDAVARLERAIAVRTGAVSADHAQAASVHYERMRQAGGGGTKVRSKYVRCAYACRTLSTLYQAASRSHTFARNFGAAALMLQPAAAVEQAALGTTSGNTLNQLAMAEYLGKQYGQAEEHFRGALSAARLRYGDNHPSVATMQANLGRTLTRLTRYDDAMTCLQEALDLHQKHRGELHVDVAVTLKDLGECCLEQRRMDDAQNYLEKALAVFAEVGGGGADAEAAATSSGKASCYALLGRLHEERDDIDEALVAYRRSLQCQLAQHGPLSADVAAARESVARVLAAADQPRESYAESLHALAVYGALEEHEACERVRGLLYEVRDELEPGDEEQLRRGAPVYGSPAPPSMAEQMVAAVAPSGSVARGNDGYCETYFDTPSVSAASSRAPSSALSTHSASGRSSKPRRSTGRSSHAHNGGGGGGGGARRSGYEPLSRSLARTSMQRLSRSSNSHSNVSRRSGYEAQPDEAEAPARGGYAARRKAMTPQERARKSAEFFAEFTYVGGASAPANGGVRKGTVNIQDSFATTSPYASDFDSGRHSDFAGSDIGSDIGSAGGGGRRKGMELTGWLWKKGGKRKNWLKRFFVLTYNPFLAIPGGCVKYYEDEMKRETKGSWAMVDVSSVRLLSEPGSKKKYIKDLVHFEVTCGSRVYSLAVETTEEAQEWLTALRSWLE